MLIRSLLGVFALLALVVPAAVALSDDDKGKPNNSSAVGQIVDRPVPTPDETQQPTSEPKPNPTAPSATLPNSMAAMGDSITRGFNTCGFFVDCERRSWSTGSDTEADSHYNGLLGQNPAIKGNAHNNAKTGAVAADMKGQAEATVKQKVDYVTMLVGANDACSDTEANITSVNAYKQRIGAALSTLKTGLPNAKLFVASVPDLKQLWEVGKGNAAARTAWKLGGICKTMLENPTSTAKTDSDRRDRVRQRVIEYNKVLEQACENYGKNCVFDNNAVFNYKFSGKVLSNWDFFHPNVRGQKELARVTREAGFEWPGGGSAKD